MADTVREAIGAAVAPYLVAGQEQDIGIADAVIDTLASLPLTAILDALGIPCRASVEAVYPDGDIGRFPSHRPVLVVDNPAADDAAP